MHMQLLGLQRQDKLFELMELLENSLEASSEFPHAFQELWESRLKQSADSLKVLGNQFVVEV